MRRVLRRQIDRQKNALILPVDSEHSAIFQALHAGRPGEVERIVLTGSGGPFRGHSAAQLAGVTVEEALRHPTWRMGPKISVDSATLMNKALEVIEAHWLFGVPPDRIPVEQPVVGAGEPGRPRRKPGRTSPEDNLTSTVPHPLTLPPISRVSGEPSGHHGGSAPPRKTDQRRPARSASRPTRRKTFVDGSEIGRMSDGRKLLKDEVSEPLSEILEHDALPEDTETAEGAD